MTRKIYLLRHGATTLNGLYAGSTDVPLANEGREQVKLTGKILATREISKIYCSPLKRCLETMALLKLDVFSELDDNLREIDFGRWEGCSFAEIAEKDKKLVEQWRTSGERFCFPGGECLKAFNQRIERFAQKLIESTDERVLIIAHGGTIRQLLCVLLGLGADKKMVFKLLPGRFCKIDLYGEIGALTGLNHP